MRARLDSSADQPPVLRAPTAADVSVIICTRDRPQMLSAALAWLAKAVPPECEVIVVDSASRSEKTRDVAVSVGARYVRSDVPGLSIARNLGLTTSSRPLVIFSDDDCALDPGFLPPLIAPFADARIDATTGLLRDEADPRGASTDPVTVLTRTLQGLDAGHGALMAFRRQAILDRGGFDPLLGAGRHFGGAEDLDAMCRLLHAGGRVARVPASVVRHVNTRDDHDYVALNTSYGLGLGAMCAKWLRGAPVDGLVLSTRVLRRAGIRYLRGLRSARARHGQAALMRGVIRGLSTARSIPAERLVFVDESPPARVPALTAHTIDGNAGAES